MVLFFSFILGSFDKDDGPQLYMVDPSGISYVRWSHCRKHDTHAVVILTLLTPWLVVSLAFVCAFRVIGAVLSEKQSKLQRQKSKNCRWEIKENIFLFLFLMTLNDDDVCVSQMKEMTCRELVKEVAKMWVAQTFIMANSQSSCLMMSYWSAVSVTGKRAANEKAAAGCKQKQMNSFLVSEFTSSMTKWRTKLLSWSSAGWERVRALHTFCVVKKQAPL